VVEGGQGHDPAALPPRKRPVTHCNKIQRRELNINFGMAVKTLRYGLLSTVVFVFNVSKMYYKIKYQNLVRSFANNSHSQVVCVIVTLVSSNWRKMSLEDCVGNKLSMYLSKALLHTSDKGQAMCVLRNIEARPCNHCCSGKVVSITQPECVCVFIALGIQHAMRMHHIVVCGLPRSKIFFHIISPKARFKKKSYWVQKVCFDFL